MEDLTLPSVGASFKKWDAVHPFSQKPWPISQTSKKKSKKISKKWGSPIGASVDLRLAPFF
jgi:hypothetical protein